MKDFFLLFLLAGYPKIPTLAVPFAFAIFFFHRNILSTFKNKYFLSSVTVIFIFISYFIGRSFFAESSFVFGEIYFIFSLTYKMLAGILIGKLIFDLLERNSNLIFLFLLIQIIFIISSAYNESLFEFLRLFQGLKQSNVFSELYQIRSLGFGIIHVEGVALLGCLYSFFIYKNQSKIFGLILSPLMYSIALTSRTAVILIPISQLLISPLKLLISILAIFLFIQYADSDIREKPLSSAFEIYNSYIETHSLLSQSSKALIRQNQTQIQTQTQTQTQTNGSDFKKIALVAFGDGKFYEGDYFYKNIDIGFYRIFNFGGFFGIALYLLVNFVPLFFLRYKSMDSKLLLLLLSQALFFCIVNFKGICVFNYAFVCFMLLAKKNKS